jgi:ribosome-associated translation inhibitor RaiA
MMIAVRGLGADQAFKAFVVGRMRAALERARVRAPSSTVVFTDENGPKGGIGVRCTLVVGMPPRGTVKIEHRAATPRLAFDASFDALERQLEARRDRTRELSRRPKKYYVAQRLLGSERPAGRAAARRRSRVVPGERP